MTNPEKGSKKFSRSVTSNANHLLLRNTLRHSTSIGLCSKHQLIGLAGLVCTNSKVQLAPTSGWLFLTFTYLIKIHVLLPNFKLSVLIILWNICLICWHLPLCNDSKVCATFQGFHYGYCLQNFCKGNISNHAVLFRVLHD